MVTSAQPKPKSTKPAVAKKSKSSPSHPPFAEVFFNLLLFCFQDLQLRNFDFGVVSGFAGFVDDHGCDRISQGEDRFEPVCHYQVYRGEAQTVASQFQEAVAVLFEEVGGCWKAHKGQELL